MKRHPNVPSPLEWATDNLMDDTVIIARDVLQGSGGRIAVKRGQAQYTKTQERFVHLIAWALEFSYNRGAEGKASDIKECLLQAEEYVNES